MAEPTGPRPRRTRVAHVVGQLAVGGMEKLLAEIARHADPARFDLRFVSLGGRGPVAEEIEACGWPVTTLDKRGGVRPGVVAWLARLFAGWSPDVVHTHNTPALLYAAPAARLARVGAVIHTRHGRDCRSGRRQRLAFRLATLLADRVVCVSDDSLRLSAAEGVAGKRLRRIWNGIDLDRFAYRGPAAGGPVVMVARLSPEKNAACLLKAARLVANEFPAFRLEVAGDGRCLPDLRRQAAETGLGETVRFLGEVRDVPAVLARAAAFVLPSLSEGVSLTLLEAMARGLPVVATAVGGTPEVVADGETGFLVPSDDPAALAARLLDLVRDPALGRRMGLAGRRRVEADFGVRGMLDRYEGIYREVLARRPGRPSLSRLTPLTQSQVA
jgi:glycosyltransferase involved in cell wall biosynthesis